MSLKVCLAIGVLVCASVSLSLVFGQSNSPITGQWMIGGPVMQDYVQFTIQRSSPNHNMSSSSTVPLNQFRGLGRAQLDSPGSAVQFQIVRDAGTFQFQGFLQGGHGGGTFAFSANPSFVNEMASLGYTGLTEETVFTSAVHDVSATYIRDMNALGIRPESIDKIVTMRIHNVTTDYVREMGSLGYTNLTPDKLVTMRIHGVTTDFARELKDKGYSSVSPDQMVTMRIHGVSTEFINELQGLGYSQPSIDQLVTMRIHGVTPEMIRKSRSLGLGNLPIDKLVSMRIHGLLE